MLVLRQELIKTQTLMDAVNQDHDKEKEHLTSELSDIRQKLQLYAFALELTLSHITNLWNSSIYLL